jgi:hypothetical protein
VVPERILCVAAYVVVKGKIAFMAREQEPHTSQVAHEEFWNAPARDLAAVFSVMHNFDH